MKRGQWACGEERSRSVSCAGVPYPWIDERKGDVRDQHPDQDEETNEHDVGHHQVDVFLDDGLVHEPADPRIGEYYFQYQGSGKKVGKEVGGAGNERVHRVAKGMVEIDPPLGDPPGTQLRDVGLAELIQHRCAYEAKLPADAAQK